MLKSSAIIKVQNDHRPCWNHQLCFAKGKSWDLLLEIKQSFTKEQAHPQEVLPLKFDLSTLGYVMIVVL